MAHTTCGSEKSTEESTRERLLLFSSDESEGFSFLFSQTHSELILSLLAKKKKKKKKRCNYFSASRWRTTLVHDAPRRRRQLTG